MDRRRRIWVRRRHRLSNIGQRIEQKRKLHAAVLTEIQDEDLNGSNHGYEGSRFIGYVVLLVKIAECSVRVHDADRQAGENFSSLIVKYTYPKVLNDTSTAPSTVSHASRPPSGGGDGSWFSFVPPSSEVGFASNIATVRVESTPVLS